MATSWLSRAAVLATSTGFMALTLPYITQNPALLSFFPDVSVLDDHLPISLRTGLFTTTSRQGATNTTTSAGQDGQQPFVCRPRSYQTEIVSLDPLVIYIRNFTSPADTAGLLAAGEPRFAPSRVAKHGRDQRTPDRTSSSAGLPRDDPAVACVLARARQFLGAVLTDDDGWDEMGPPQLVRYTAGQRFNVHRDWYDAPRPAADGSARRWNRVASFFVVLQDGCAGGETYFPHLRTPARQVGRERRAREDGEAAGKKDEDWEWTDADPAWRLHQDGGVAFRPVAGNAVFWMNLHANGTGDWRTMHAGLPVGSGLKTAMNIWPRQYYADE
ncbi:uncharacterized protein E0L32_011615 [Thyridium curvatum]|uniref:Prolyl 4-hydroxylase alpha subunit domain-containing protein n=1 Tax=Thyridium curvatum TaxID=1093900 RepID=A0A507B850_9PEZI|nr:uncharacterized protein E0L32_011615 [Thyridium curvatum]TPX18502.1 hypothetical protein E0L32_011615 [Thyridium curvatum]